MILFESSRKILEKEKETARKKEEKSLLNYYKEIYIFSPLFRKIEIFLEVQQKNNNKYNNNGKITRLHYIHCLD